MLIKHGLNLKLIFKKLIFLNVHFISMGAFAKTLKEKLKLTSMQMVFGIKHKNFKKKSKAQVSTIT